ncbi:MAG: zinc-dependent metalloprotease [Candidatus Pseudobacter hemicellulosilyticus]|uniref:Zinc-dependent metalloprotease n=1 Tax=Candidatus Pseudobacter hemicellulosilyticus TaxID=3121375 RepID=A0AAJ5WS78_9BACT|nr:MAG: zinc-dependent metalloprotease [Pseudobacter sp.]
MTDWRKPFLPLLAGITLFACMPAANAQKDSTQKTIPSAAGMKPYKQVITDSARTRSSFFKIHTLKERFYFEIPDTMLGKDLLAVTRIDKGAYGFVMPFVQLGYSGDECGRMVIRFEKIPGDKLALRSVKFTNLADDSSSNGLARSLANNQTQAIEAVFPVKAYNPEDHSSVIDVTDFLTGKSMTTALITPIPLFGNIFDFTVPDRSFVSDIMAFPENIEVMTTKTLLNKANTTITMELNTSFIRLPQIPMKPRLADLRVGYFSNEYMDFSSDPVAVRRARYIQRWRLEPKPGEEERYNRGELVEPKKPIVIYIDPATPEKWVPFLIAGVNDWQAAFEKAGFKNAIIGKEAPAGDSSWSLYDARHSVIVYKPSAIQNASGPNVNDPRTGEILETHINWYHSVQSLIRKWYVIQAGAIDPGAQQPELDDELMGQLIRFVSSHEVGHTLGLKHNFGSSSTVPVEKLRNKAWVEANGHTPSIMDYARFNYVAQPEDSISRQGIFPRIGEYDKWAIEWGYKWLPRFPTAESEKSFMNKWVVEQLAAGSKYFYGSQLEPLTDEYPFNTDPRSQSEDLGDDVVLASGYGLKNLKRIRPQLMAWAVKPGENYDGAATLYNELVNQYSRFIVHVFRSIGGVYITPKTAEQAGPVFELVPRNKQKKAMAFLQQELFATPVWLMDTELYQVSNAGFAAVPKLQNEALGALLDQAKVLLAQEREFPGNNYPAAELLEDLRKGIFSELVAGKPVTDVVRRDLQNMYVKKLAAVLVSNSTDLSQFRTVLTTHARLLARTLSAAAVSTTQPLLKAHLSGLQAHLEAALNYKPVLVINPAAGKPAGTTSSFFDDLFRQECW